MSKATNKTLLWLFAMLFSSAVFGQNDAPFWLDADVRTIQYAGEQYYTGFAAVAVSSNKNAEQATAQAKQTALGELTGSLRATVSTHRQQTKISVETNREEQNYSRFSSEISVSSNVEIVGSKVETYFDQKANTIYAFAYADKYEIIGYYKSNLSVNLNQAESFVRTAQDLKTAGEKAKARQELERAMPLFDKIRTAQDLLATLDAQISAEDLQQEKTERLYNTVMQLRAALAQAVYFFISGNENLFGKAENIIANKVKADLANKGCSFVENAEEADFVLKINADIRLSSQNGGIVFCFADVEVELFDNHKQKAVFGDEFSEKGGSSSQEKAGRKAMETAANKIAEKLINWIQ
ncbi:MAG: hypothetical protein LBH19_07920 [Dysgonamonadaceae bacterium]|jgi:hypothetical protein|nr:hypothetical protein [Dysgonamonadaceae bacterium]